MEQYMKTDENLVAALQSAMPTNLETMKEWQMKAIAKAIAMIVRNGMEDLHADGEISDALMAKLNPVIRNGIYSGLHALGDGHPIYILFALSLIPKYWEQPQFLEDYEGYLALREKEGYEIGRIPFVP